MKVSRLEIDVKFVPSFLISEIFSKCRTSRSFVKTCILDKNAGLKSRWRASACPANDVYLEEEGEGPGLPVVDYRVHLLNFEDFRNENVVVLGNAYVEKPTEDCFAYEVNKFKQINLELVHLQNLTNSTVWRVNGESPNDGIHGHITFHANITVIYFKPTLTKIRGDFGDLFESGFNSDIILQVGQESFNVHKNILGARSPVFRRMFETDMKQKQEGKVEIEDIRSQVFREMLKFMYTGSLGPASEPGILEDMYVAADKYYVLDLKDNVAEKLCDGITEENVTKRLALAEQFGDLALKEKCQKFIKNEPDSDSDSPMSNHEDLFTQGLRYIEPEDTEMFSDENEFSTSDENW